MIQLARAAAAALTVLVAGHGTAAAAPACDRACLIAVADAYLAALAVFVPYGSPMGWE